ncbi:MAG: cation diffusion facilitator family transporter [Gracilibacteraceae bacterium]|jgi:cation diffusion facilitator family transporter|nr:cation diffusion facilitator family transporter [Gracilibacteraceae bacterium]
MDFTKKFTKSAAASLSVISNTTLVILKIIVGLLSGSVSILSEAMHSGMDLIASLIAFISVRISSRPPDKTHPYGHGKIENLTAAIEALLLLAVVFFIIQEAVKKIITPEPLHQTELAIAVMLFSMTANIIVSRILYRVAKREDSIALEGNALHLKTDVYTSAGIALGLILIYFTNWYILDPIIAIATALLILRETIKLLGHALNPLLDSKLTEEEEQRIVAVIEQFRPRIHNYHDLKTRRSGAQRYIEFHLELDPTLSIQEFEEISNQIEHNIDQVLNQQVLTTIHAETPVPCDKLGIKDISNKEK